MSHFKISNYKITWCDTYLIIILYVPILSLRSETQNLKRFDDELKFLGAHNNIIFITQAFLHVMNVLNRKVRPLRSVTFENV